MGQKMKQPLHDYPDDIVPGPDENINQTFLRTKNKEHRLSQVVSIKGEYFSPIFFPSFHSLPGEHASGFSRVYRGWGRRNGAVHGR